MNYYKKYQSQEWVDIQNELSNEFKDNNNLKPKPMKLTKKDFKNGIKFMTKFSDTEIYTFSIASNGAEFIQNDILFSCKKLAIKGNFYCLESLTDKYFKMFVFQFGQKQIFKVKLSDIKIVDIEYRTL